MNEARLYKNVFLGKNVEIGDYVIIGKPPKGKADGELKTVIGDNAIIRSHTVIYAGNQIGDRFQTGHHVLIREENEFGNDVSIGSGSVVEHHVRLNDGVRLHSQVFICEYSRCNAHAWIGPNVVFTNAKYPEYEGVMDHLIGATVGEKAKVGANTTLLPEIEIGPDALIGAGSVVTKSVPGNEVWVGNPAKKLKDADSVRYV